MRWIYLAIVSLLVACGDDTAPPASTNNMSVGTNSQTNTNNTQTNTSNNATLPSTNQSTTQTNNTTGPLPDCDLLEPEIGVCDPLCQRGCDSGEACVTEENAEGFEVSCVDAGAGIQDTPCETDSDCRAGLTCLAPEGGESVCVEYCRTGSDAQPQCAPDYTCRPFGRESRVGICFLATNECTFFPDSCPADRECYSTDNGTRCGIFDPEAEPGVTCENSNECNEGFRCAGTGASDLTCKQICNPDEEVDTCPESTTCQIMRNSSGESLGWGACF